MNKPIKTAILSGLVCTTALFAVESPMDVKIDNYNVYQLDGDYILPDGNGNNNSQKSQDNSAISPELQETESDFQPIEGKVTVNTTLRLREYPWGPVLGSYTNNTKVTIIGEEGEFYKVKLNGKTGYLHKNYVSTPTQPASCVEPNYPGTCKTGGYVARSTSSSTSGSTNAVATAPSAGSKASSSSNSSNSTGVKAASPSVGAADQCPLPVKSSVIGARAGDGTAAGAITWAKDQMIGGSMQGYNKNNGKISTSPTCWNHWCGAFIATAWGRKIPQMVAGSAYGQYKNFKRDGMIHTDKNPPAGAIMFTGPTATSEYGHVFMATGEHTANGEPIVITSGWTGHDYITTMTLSQMIGSKNYLGWALP